MAMMNSEKTSGAKTDCATYIRARTSMAGTMAPTVLVPPVIRTKPRLVVHGIANDRAGHAMAAATSAPKFRAGDGDDLNALFAQQRIGIGVAIIGKDHAGRGADEIGSAVPLGALAHVIIATGFDDAHLLQSQRVAHRINEAALVLVQFDAAFSIRAIGKSSNPVHNVR